MHSSLLLLFLASAVTLALADGPSTFDPSSVSTGTRKVLVVRVQLNNKAFPKTATELASNWFSDSANLASQYKACSYGKLNFVAASGTGISNGVVDVSISASASNKDAIRSAAVTAAKNKINGAAYDHIMICVPPGSDFSPSGDNPTEKGESAGDKAIFYNDDCSGLLYQLHEVGHNLGLQHSGGYDGGSFDKYLDQSCIMGYSSTEDDGPKRCFNAAKSSQLGWYKNREATFNAVAGQTWRGKLIGVADWQSSTSAHTMILKIPLKNSNSQTLYMTYNRAKGITAGIKSYYANRVHIVRDPECIGSSCWYSGIQASLLSGETHKFTVAGTTWTIKVESMGSDGSVDYALTSVTSGSGTGGTSTPRPTPRSGTSPTRASTGCADNTAWKYLDLYTCADWKGTNCRTYSLSSDKYGTTQTQKEEYRRRLLANCKASCGLCTGAAEIPQYESPCKLGLWEQDATRPNKFCGAGSCKMYTATTKRYKTCAHYCAYQEKLNGGLACVGAWETNSSNCDAKTGGEEITCATDFRDGLETTDMICECRYLKEDEQLEAFLKGDDWLINPTMPDEDEDSNPSIDVGGAPALASSLLAVAMPLVALLAAYL